MKTNHKKSGRIFILSLFTAIIFCMVMAGLFALRDRSKAYREEPLWKRRAYFNAFSGANLILHELTKSSEKRWSEGWTLLGNTCIYTDSDGTKYEASLTENGRTALCTGRYGGKKALLKADLGKKN
ncbi:MAG: hypothetical protein JW774_07015 [Candidatus Aureabacteria bacterium]|nr:hypothetical protein [Candidatus Auribacterota bacterium]